MNDPFNLSRFVDAQNRVYDAVCAELRRGHKTSHWMWFIFPQIEGLGRSEMSRRYAISSLEEARAYLAHPILGPRLIECTGIVNQTDGRTIEEIFGFPDDAKFRSCMTLFAHAAPENRIFELALQKYFDGQEDSVTLGRLDTQASS